MKKAERNRQALKALLSAGKTIVAPGAFDPISARLIEKAGFPALYVGSYATAAARFGLPDVGAVTLDELAAHAKVIVDAVDIPVLADAENGMNNAANIWRTVQAFEQAGVCGVHLEDHELGKHTAVRPVLASVEQMTQKIRAARDAREDENFMIVGRTDAAWALKDTEETIRRLNAFTDAGADMVMPAALSPSRLATVRSRINGKVMLTDTRGFSLADEENAGVDIVLYYGFTLYAAYHGIKIALESFKASRNADAVSNLREVIDEFERFMGYSDYNARAKTYGLGMKGN